MITIRLITDGTTKGQARAQGGGYKWRRSSHSDPGSRRVLNTPQNAVRPVGAKITGNWRSSSREFVFNRGSLINWMKFKNRMQLIR